MSSKMRGSIVLMTRLAFAIFSLLPASLPSLLRPIWMHFDEAHPITGLAACNTKAESRIRFQPGCIMLAQLIDFRNLVFVLASE
jgi:hypothetical protein